MVRRFADEKSPGEPNINTWRNVIVEAKECLTRYGGLRVARRESKARTGQVSKGDTNTGAKKRMKGLHAGSPRGVKDYCIRRQIEVTGS